MRVGGFACPDLLVGDRSAIILHMEPANPPTSRTAERGAKFYEDKLRGLLEPGHNGKYVVIDVESGQYELDADHLAASDRAAARWPGARLYATRVGTGSLGRIGGRLAAKRS